MKHYVEAASCYLIYKKNTDTLICLTSPWRIILILVASGHAYIELQCMWINDVDSDNIYYKENVEEHHSYICSM